MLPSHLYSNEDTSAECCSTVHCKCLNVRMDFINQANRDGTEYEYEAMETALETQSGLNSTLFFRSFLLAIDIKFKWLIGCSLIYNDSDNRNATPSYLYKCHCCSHYLFASTSNILGKCLLNYELQNFEKFKLLKKPSFSASFKILVENSGHVLAICLYQSQIRSILTASIADDSQTWLTTEMVKIRQPNPSNPLYLSVIR